MAVAILISLAANVLTDVLKSALSFILTEIAEKLQDEDLTDQTFRGLILFEREKINSKLDGIAKKELRASIAHMQKGIKRLNTVFDDHAAVSTEIVTIKEAVTIADAITKLRIESSEFKKAIKPFKEAARTAALAFHNTALSIEERILATKVRLTSAILENLEHPGILASDCLQYLKELHEMGAIREIFSVYNQGGIKSRFYKDSRKEIVETVTMINLILADFISKFTKQRMAVYDWPTIVCGKQVVHPIHFKSEGLPNLSEMKITPPWDIVEFEHVLKLSQWRWFRPNTALLTLNKKGDLVCFTEDKHGPQKLVKTTHELQPYCHHELGFHVLGIAVDEDDTVYVVTHHEDAGSSLSVYSADGRNKDKSTLTLDHPRFIVGIAITDDKNIVISEKYSSDKVYVYNRNGELKSSFELKEDSAPDYFAVYSVSVSSDNEIALVTYNYNFSKDFYRLSTYTQDGKIQRTVNFRTSSDWSDWYDNIFYNHVTNIIIGYGGNRDDGKSFIEFMSGETGELQCSYLLYFTNFPEEMSNFCLVCHTNGTMALVGKRHVIYLQNSSPST